MIIINNIKIELILFLIVSLFAFFLFRVDIFFQTMFSDYINELGGGYLKSFFIEITKFGSSLWYFIITIFFSIMLFLNKKINVLNIKEYKRKINFFISSFIYIFFAGILTQILKHLVGRPRPNYINNESNFGFDFLSLDSSYHSFPSGHSSTIFMVCFILCATLPKIRYFFYFLTLLVAFSRVVVGAHFLSDVIAGALISLIVFNSLNLFLRNNYKQFLFSEIDFKKNTELCYYIIFYIILCVFLTVAPSLDMYISSIFYFGNSQFFLQSFDLLSLLFRKMLLPAILFYLLVFPIISQLISIDKIFFGYRFSFKEIFLIWISQFLIIIGFVNLVLKNLWGRARPGEIMNLGGDNIFTPWYQYSNACNMNCSFVSGDASVGFSLIILYLITKNVAYFYLSIFFGFVIGFIRILAGGHFFSDILFAGLFVVVLNILIYQIYKRIL